MNEKNQFIFKWPIAVTGEVSNLLIIFSFFFLIKSIQKYSLSLLCGSCWTPQGHGLLPGDLVENIGEPATLLPRAGGQAFCYNCGLHNCEFK